MSNKEIHKFALKWFDKFRDTKATGRDLCEDTAFADECFALGFQMDCGESFIAAYPDLNVFSDYRELDKIIDSVKDIQLLGSAIFSKWRYFNHWRVIEKKLHSRKTEDGLLLRSADWNC